MTVNVLVHVNLPALPDPDVIAEAIKTVRAARGLNLREAALAIGISHNTLWRIEQGESTSYPKVLEALRWMDAGEGQS